MGQDLLFVQAIIVSGVNKVLSSKLCCNHTIAVFWSIGSFGRSETDSNEQRRLELLYQGRFSLDINKSDLFYVNQTINLDNEN